MWNSHNAKLVKEGSFRILNAKLVKEELSGGKAPGVPDQTSYQI